MNFISCLANVCTIFGAFFAVFVYFNWKNNEISRSRVNCLIGISTNLHRLDQLMANIFSRCVIGERNNIQTVRLYYNENADLIANANKLISNIDFLMNDYRALNINDRYKDGIEEPDVDAYTMFWVSRLFNFIGPNGHIEFIHGELRYSQENFASNSFGHCSSFAELSFNFYAEYQKVKYDITKIISKY